MNLPPLTFTEVASIRSVAWNVASPGARSLGSHPGFEAVKAQLPDHFCSAGNQDECRPLHDKLARVGDPLLAAIQQAARGDARMAKQVRRVNLVAHARMAEPALTEDQRALLRSYTSEAHPDINQKLRAGTASAALLQHYAPLDAAIASWKLPEQTKVYRYVKGAEFQNAVLKLGSGATVTDPGYMSTSYDPQYQLNHWRSARADAPVTLLAIDAPAGTPAVVPQRTRWRSEAEVLFGRNTTLEYGPMRIIERQDQNGNTVRNLIVQARIVPVA